MPVWILNAVLVLLTAVNIGRSWVVSCREQTIRRPTKSNSTHGLVEFSCKDVCPPTKVTDLDITFCVNNCFDFFECSLRNLANGTEITFNRTRCRVVSYFFHPQHGFQLCSRYCQDSEYCQKYCPGYRRCFSDLETDDPSKNLNESAAAAAAAAASQSTTNSESLLRGRSWDVSCRDQIIRRPTKSNSTHGLVEFSCKDVCPPTKVTDLDITFCVNNCFDFFECSLRNLANGTEITFNRTPCRVVSYFFHPQHGFQLCARYCQDSEYCQKHCPGYYDCLSNNQSDYLFGQPTSSFSSSSATARPTVVAAAAATRPSVSYVTSPSHIWPIVAAAVIVAIIVVIVVVRRQHQITAKSTSSEPQLVQRSSTECCYRPSLNFSPETAQTSSLCTWPPTAETSGIVDLRATDDY